MKSKLRILSLTLYRSNFIISLLLLFLLFLGFYLIWTPFFYFLFDKWDIAFAPTPNETIMKQPIYEQIFWVVIIGPLIETLLSQKLVYKLLSLIKFLKRHKVIIMILGAIAFGVLHFYSLSYIVFATFMGFLLMYAYIVRINKKPYWTVAALHGLANLFAIFVDPIEKIIFGVV